MVLRGRVTGPDARGSDLEWLLQPFCRLLPAPSCHHPALLLASFLILLWAVLPDQKAKSAGDRTHRVYSCVPLGRTEKREDPGGQPRRGASCGEENRWFCEGFTACQCWWLGSKQSPIKLTGTNIYKGRDMDMSSLRDYLKLFKMDCNYF